MIDFIRSLPGWLVAAGQAHPFWFVLGGIVLLGAGYLIVFKIAIALEDARDVRNRRL